MLINIILLILGFVILIKGADFFVDGASSVAQNFKVSKMLIGLTIVAFGTSLPEFAVSVKSILLKSGDLVLGNVIGSNILNILLILGLSAMFHPLTVKNNTVKKELPIAMLITVLFAILLSDNIFNTKVFNEFTRSDGLILLLFFTVFIYYLISMLRNKVANSESKSPLSLQKAIAFTVLGIIAIMFGSSMVVNHSTQLARLLGVSERMIALTIVALGTSLPELVTSLTATKKGEYDIAIGNVVGSNIFNIGIVIGLPIALFGGVSNITFSYIDIVTMILSAILLFMFSFNDYKISKKEGLIFLLLFISYYGYVIFA